MRYLKPILVYLSIFFFQSFLSAQDLRTIELPKDSVLIRQANGEEEVRYVFQAIEPERISDVTQVGLHLSSKEESQVQPQRLKKKTQGVSNLSNYAVGTIPIQSGVTSTGGKTYSIPIMTAPGYHLVPNISLYYNSQSGNGIAGYGWNIAGLSSVEIRDKNMFYDNVREGAIYSDPTACYSLDGVPLVKSENLMKGYELATAKGNIQIHKHQNNYATPAYFEVLYPNGDKAIFGFKNNYESQISYPITEYEDIDGNKITFDYFFEKNVYYIKSIQYGKSSNIKFVYKTGALGSPIDYMVAGKEVDKWSYLLSEITISDNGKEICRYILESDLKDGVSLLKGVRQLVNSRELPPLAFTYEIDNKDELSNYPILDLRQTSIFKEFFKESPDTLILYKRGKASSCSKNDMIVSLPSFPNYQVVAKKKKLFKTYYKYGSGYNPQQRILVNMDNAYETRQERIYAGSGFQTIDVVDIDGDGEDEIVKINNGSTQRGITDYKITIYRIRQENQKDSSAFTITVNDGTYNDYFTNPVKSLYYYGNFSGDGKTQLVIATRYGSKVALVDLEKKEKLCETTLFKINEEDESRILTADFENKGKTDLVHITDNGANVYSFKRNDFSYNKNYKGAGLNDLCLADNYVIDGEYQIVPCSIFSMDINGDGYMDIVSMPDIVMVEGGVLKSSTVYVSLFNGVKFSTYKYKLFVRENHSQPTFVDVDKDGLPDILYCDDTSLYCIFNEQGIYKNTPINVGPKMSSIKVIAPNDISIWGQYADVSLIEGPTMELYTFRKNHTENRQLVSMSDSFNNVEYNAYTNLFTVSDYYDDNHLCRYSKGYVRRAIPMYVLTNNIKYEGLTNIQSNSVFYYTDAVYNTQGLGFCGFGKMEISESVSKTVTTQTFDPEKFGAVIKIDIRKANKLYTTTTNTYDNHTTIYGKLDPRLISSRTQDSLSGITTTQSYTYDNYGYPLTIETKKDLSGFPTQSSILRNRYAYVTMEDEYVLGILLNDAIDTNLDSKTDTVWRESNTYQYDKWCHRLSKITNRGLVKSGQSAEGLIGTRQASFTKWTYDTSWNVTSEKTALCNSTTFVGKTYGYDADGRFLKTSTDALGRTTTYSDYTSLGKPTKDVDYNGNETIYEYDAIGNLLRITKPDGAQYETSYEWGGKGLYKITTMGTDSSQGSRHYDSMGREIFSQVRRFDGSYRNIEKCYDDRGRLIKESLPYKGDTAAYWITYKYDDYDRIISRNEPSEKVSSWKYEGTTTTSTIDGITSTKKMDAFGNVVNMVDEGGIITYYYRDDGQPKRIVAPGNISTVFEYDMYGRRTKMIDPSAGTQSESYVWNMDGTSNTTHTNPNGWLREHKDEYGRATLVERSDGYSTTYTYDAKGRLSTEISTNDYAKEYTYDNFNRVTRLKESIPDGKYLETLYGYRIGGRIDSIRYTSQHSYLATECYQYTNGYNTGIRLEDGKEVWSLIKENEFGLPTEINTDGLKREYGYTDFGLPTYRRIDGGEVQEEIYEFEPQTSNLLSRTEYKGGKSESFTYDKMNRLTGINGRTIRYQSNGNITEIEGVGQMRYSNSSKPYQLTSLYPEDSLYVGGAQRITYSCENRPLTITEGDKSVEFTYGPDGARVRMVEKEKGSIKRVHWYISDKYEYVANESGEEISEILYLGGDAYNAPMMWRNGNSDWQIGRDYLGSIKQVVAPDGALSGDYSYDPWGRLRNKVTFEVYEIGKEPYLFTGRGYTGHEHLQQFGLINMNARLYDPLLGRFLSPDPYVQAPDYTQNFNRYSYALNNPLKYTDEDGEWLTSSLIIGTLLGTTYGVGNLIAHDIRGDNLGNGKWAKYFFAGFGAGFVLGSWVGVLGSSAFGAKVGAVGLGTFTRLNSVNFIMSAGNGIFNGNKNWFNNYVTSSMGKYYLDENKSFFEEMGEGISRYSWEVFQEAAGYGWTSIRNGWTDRVDLWGGATFSTRYTNDEKYNGVTLGSFININFDDDDSDARYKRIDYYGDFDSFMNYYGDSSSIKEELYIHEYGHVIQSKKWGLGYLPIPALLSIVNCATDTKNHDYYWTEYTAVRYAYAYFNKYNINHYEVLPTK